MNKWKTAFWICLVLLVGVSAFSFYSIIDQGVTITYMREGYQDTENDLNTLIELVNKTDLSQTQIRDNLKTHPLFEHIDFNEREVHMERVTLVFENGNLERIEKQW